MKRTGVEDSSVLERSLGVETIDLEDQCVVVDLLRSESWRLNSTGSDVWRILDKRTTFGELVDVASATWGVSKERCRDELGQFISKMVDVGVVGGNIVRVTKGTGTS